MIFSSPEFFIFFAIYLLFHFLAPIKYRVPLIILGSAFFYGYHRWEYAALPFALIGFAYVGALIISQQESEPVRKRRLAATIALLLLPLLFYKYADFLYLSLVAPLISAKDPLVNLPLPLGISFITFTLISYVVDVYKNKFPVERNFSVLSAYILFFPQLIAGPILKPHELIPQLENPGSARKGAFMYGAAVFTFGLVKKMVFADSIALFVDSVYKAAPGSLGTLDYVTAIYGFPLQIYCDFSGYTDMALGLGYILGVTLPNNFSRPYVATSLIDFWRRWHITLSFWLRDYLYIPLGGNRRGFPKEVRNILITMTLGGLWHGASWTFIAWGALHGIGIVISHIVKKGALGRVVERIPKWVKILITFHIVTLLWVFFRARDFQTVYNIISGVFTTSLGDMPTFLTNNGFYLFIILMFYITHAFDDHAHIFYFIHKVPRALVWGVLLIIVAMCFALGGGNSAAFIYFDF